MLTLRDDENAPPAPNAHAIMDDFIIDISSPNILRHVVGESDYVDPPLSFNILSRYVSCSDDILAFFIYGFEHFQVFACLFY